MDRRYRKPLSARLRLGSWLAAALALTALGYLFERFAVRTSLTVESERLRISEVTLATFRDYIPINGTVVPSNTVYVDAVEGGQVVEVYVEEGELVQAGQPLVGLKNTNLQLEVIGREAQLTEQINNLSMARLAFEQARLQNERDLISIDYRVDQLTRALRRHGMLADSGGTTRERLDELEAEHAYQLRMHAAVSQSQSVDRQFRRTQIEQLQSAIDSMNDNLRIARDNLSSLVLKAPISGQLTMLDADRGESLSRGRRVAQIDELDVFKVSALVDEFYLARVHVGNPAAVAIDEQEMALTVTKVFPEVRDRQFEIELAFAHRPESLRRGQSLKLELVIGASRPALVVRNGPFFDTSGGLWAFVVDADGATALRRSVELGRRNQDVVEVVDGLREGDRIIVSSYETFGNADRLLLDRN